MHICIGITHAGEIKFETANTLAMMAYHQALEGNEFNIMGAESCLCQDNANEIMEAARTSTCDYLFFLDFDVFCRDSANLIKRMIDLDKDVVVGIYHQGQWPYRPIVYYFTEEGMIQNYENIPDGVFQVDAAGAGWMLIKKKVLELFTPEVTDEIGLPFDNVCDDKKVRLKADAGFFWRLRQLGVEVWADTGIKLEHIKKQGVTRDHFETAKQYTYAQIAEQKCGTPTP